MHSTDTKSQFIELGAKGWSLARITVQLNVSPRTLVDWHAQAKAEIAVLRALELEALHERVLLSHEEQLARLTQPLKAIEAALDNSNYKYEKNTDLHRMASIVRAEIRKACPF
jgi:hypothetical protein